MVAESEQESNSQIWKISGPGSGFKNFGTGAEWESEKESPAISDIGRFSCCFHPTARLKIDNSKSIYQIDLRFSDNMHFDKQNIRLKFGCKIPSMKKSYCVLLKSESSVLSNNKSDALGTESGWSIHKLVTRKVLDALIQIFKQYEQQSEEHSNKLWLQKN